MLKPLIITSPNPRGTGGQVRNYHVLKELARNNLIKEGILVIDYASSSGIRELEDLGYRIIAIKNFSRTMEDEQYLIKAFLHVKKTLEKEDYDIIVSQSEHARYVQTAYVLHRLLKIPWTAIIQSFLWLQPFRYGFNPTTIMRTSTSIRLLNKSLVHVISEAVPHALSLTGYNLRFYTLLDVPVGIDHELINGTLTNPPEKYYDIAYMARVTTGKGILDLIYIAYKLRSFGLDAKFLVIGEFGDEYLRKTFMKYSQKLDVLRNFTFTGFITGAEKYKLLSACKVFVYPSKIDSFPISLLEALAVGLPAVTTNAPFTHPFREVVVVASNTDNMVEAIRGLLSDEAARKELGRKARDFSKKFTHEAAAKSEYKAYLKTLEWFINHAKI